MEYWRKLQAAVPAYRVYRFRTEREIPILLLRRQPALDQKASTDLLVDVHREAKAV